MCFHRLCTAIRATLSTSNTNADISINSYSLPLHRCFFVHVSNLTSMSHQRRVRWSTISPPPSYAAPRHSDAIFPSQSTQPSTIHQAGTYAPFTPTITSHALKQTCSFVAISFHRSTPSTLILLRATLVGNTKIVYTTIRTTWRQHSDLLHRSWSTANWVLMISYRNLSLKKKTLLESLFCAPAPLSFLLIINICNVILLC